MSNTNSAAGSDQPDQGSSQVISPPPADTAAPASSATSDGAVAPTSADNADTGTLPDASTSNTGTDAPTVSNVPDTQTQVVTIPSDNLVNVMYTVDGTDWKELGTVTADNWQGMSFDINDPALNNFDNLSKLQISVKTLPTDGTPPVIYLDSAYIEATYENAPAPEQSNLDLPKVSLNDSANINIVSGDADFTLDDTPTFVVSDPKLSRSDIQQLIKDDKAEVVSDPEGVLGQKVVPIDTQAIPVTSTDDQSALPAGTVAVPASTDGGTATVPVPADAAASAPTTVVPSAPLQLPDPSNTADSLKKAVDSVINTITPYTSNDPISPPANVPDTPQDAPLPSPPPSSQGTSFLHELFYPKIAMAQYTPTRISDVTVLDPNDKVADIGVTLKDVTIDGVDHQQVILEKPPRSFQSGQYKMIVTLDTSEASLVSEQDFTWGVLAINTDRSIYRKGDTASIQIGVLDNHGHTLCNAGLDLTITDPNGAATHLTSDNGGIQTSGLCDGDNVVDQPDYQGQFPVPDLVGTYQMLLTADTANGTHSIHDSFNVAESVPFDVVRTAPSRIYPAVPYPVTMTITPTMKRFLRASRSRRRKIVRHTTASRLSAIRRRFLGMLT